MTSSRHNRRAFLARLTTAAAASWALPQIVPATALGAGPCLLPASGLPLACWAWGAKPIS